jgi:predicted DCC family thiol-disulfide oxidoreductase YuxK
LRLLRSAIAENGGVTPREQPVLVYDGDCAFCTKCAHAVERIGPQAEVVPWQFADLDDLGITEAQATEAVRWVEVDGAVRSGHEAIAASLIAAGGAWKLIGRALLAPGISSLAAPAYRLVARNRYRLPGGTPACAMPRAMPRDPPSGSGGPRRQRQRHD